ncbi:oxygenase MpaB family protein [Nakamurella sp.]|uniref:oxygenase MpaB family protein n=1 Tax=Nakamurella sp. TaxID=1869182 RepID=UPI003B3A24E6
MTGDDGLFGPASVTWAVHADPVFPVAGVRALLLQALHPVTMAAVAQHGGFDEDFWGRLERTVGYVNTVTFGPAGEARRTAARVRGVHRRLRGTDPATGRTFRLDEPDLLLWVHCCQVESYLGTARRAGAPVDLAAADRYVAEQVLAAELIGIPADLVPTTVGGLQDYFRAVRPVLAVSDDARRAVRQLAVPPMASWVRLLTPAWPAWLTLAGLAAGLLPRWARRLYRLPGLPITDPVATAALRALRAGTAILPERFSGPPEVRAARARAAALAAASPAGGSAAPAA